LLDTYVVLVQIVREQKGPLKSPPRVYIREILVGDLVNDFVAPFLLGWVD
jgi:hypothetical protein